jgi:hypothetical protein
MLFAEEHHTCIRLRQAARAAPTDEVAQERAYWLASTMEVTNYHALDPGRNQGLTRLSFCRPRGRARRRAAQAGLTALQSPRQNWLAGPGASDWDREPLFPIPKRGMQMPTVPGAGWASRLTWESYRQPLAVFGVNIASSCLG